MITLVRPHGVPHIEWAAELITNKAHFISPKSLTEAIEALDVANNLVSRFVNRGRDSYYSLELIRRRGQNPVLRARWLGLASRATFLSRRDPRFRAIGPKDMTQA